MSVGCLRWQVMCTDRPGKGNKPALWGDRKYGIQSHFQTNNRGLASDAFRHILFPIILKLEKYLHFFLFSLFSLWSPDHLLLLYMNLVFIAFCTVSPAWGNAWVFHRYLRSVSPVRKISHLLFPLSSSTATTGKSPNLPSPRLIRDIQPSIPPHHRMSASLLASKMNLRAFTTVRCSRTWTLTETRSNVSSLVETRMDCWMVEILANNHWCVSVFYTDSEHSIQCKEYCTSVMCFMT